MSPMVRTTPGEVLRKEFLVPRGISQTELARWLGISAHRVGRILAGRSKVTAFLAWGLGMSFGTMPDFWLTLQACVDLRAVGARTDLGDVGHLKAPIRPSAQRRPPTPGEILREEFLVPMGISQAELARRAGLDPRQVGRIVRDRQAITAPIALKLSRALRMTPRFWLNCQMCVDLWDARPVPQRKESR